MAAEQPGEGLRALPGATTLSQRERMAAEQPGEGLPTRQVIHASRVRASYRKIVTPHPPPPAAPSPSGRGFERSVEARVRRPWLARARNVGAPANFFNHPIESFLHFVIGETKLNEPVALDALATQGVALDLLKMMFAVELDCQAKIVAAEISDESRDRHLSAEFQAIEPTAAKLLPKHVFGGRALGPQTPRNLDWPFSHEPQSDHQRLRPQPLTRRLRRARRPSPRGSGWLRSSRVRGYRLCRLRTSTRNIVALIFQRSQPLTRRLRRYPLPQGEGLGLHR